MHNNNFVNLKFPAYRSKSIYWLSILIIAFPLITLSSIAVRQYIWGSTLKVVSSNNTSMIQQKQKREPVEVVTFTVYDVAIFPHEVRANQGLIAVSMEDLSGGSAELVVANENGNSLINVKKEEHPLRGRGEIKLVPGRYQVYDAKHPNKKATLIIEP